MAADVVDVRSRHRGLLLVAVVAVAAVACGTLAWLWFRPDRVPEQAQITGFSRAGTTSLLVAYVRGDDQRVLDAYADETAASVTLHVVLSPDANQGATGTHPAYVLSTTIALKNPVGDRAVIDARGDAVVEQPPGVIPAPVG